MRTFVDERGAPWEVVLGRESWGSVVAIFVPRTVGPEDRAEEDMPAVRQVSLGAAGYAEANEELGAMSEAELRALLCRALPKDPEGR